MTKKDYVRFAAMIKERHDYIKGFLAGESLTPEVMRGAEAQLFECKYYAREMADIFALDNPRFDNRQFFSACGIWED